MESLRGKLLIASPAIMDPNFRQTVVLLAEHSEEGAMGVVLNREGSVTVAEAVPDLAYLAEPGDLVHVGGPVSSTSVTVLADFEAPQHAALLVDETIGFVPAAIEEQDEIASAVRRTRVFAGHAGWGPGQLEEEMEEESWIVEDPLEEDVFTTDPEALWASVLRRKGGEYAVIATMPLDPSLN
jgi:putative transcriptional regulator